MSILKKAGGIFYGWWVVIASVVIFLFVGGSTVYGFSAFFDPIVKDMGWTRAEAAVANSLRSVESGISSPVFGFLIDRIGTRKCIFIGITIISVALVLMSRINNIYAYYACFMLMSTGMSAGLSNAEYTAVANWFKRRRGLALGLVASGFGLCGLMSPVLVYLIDTYGWRDALLILAPAILAIGLPLSLVIKHRPEPYGLLPDGDKAPPESTLTGPANKTPGASNEGLTWRQCVSTRNFWFMILFTFFTGFCQSSINVFNISHLTNVGIPREIAGWAVTGITLSSLIGRLGFAWLGDRFSKKKLIILAAAMEAVGVFVFAYINSPWMIIPFLLLYGPGFGAPIPLMQAIQAECFGTKAFASLRGLLSVGWTIPGLIAPYFAGLLCDIQGNYRTAFVIYGVIAVFAVPAVMAINVKPLAGKTAVTEPAPH
jgi:MFS family permease